MGKQRAYSDPTADQALRNIAMQAQREYEERHRRKSPDVIRVDDDADPARMLAEFLKAKSEEHEESEVVENDQ